MSAYAKQQRLMKRYGVAGVKRAEISGNTAIWHVTLTNGDVLTVNTHRLGSETGVLQSVSRMVKPV